MAAGDLTDLATVKALMSRSDNNSDAALAILITQASDHLVSRLSHNVVVASYTERYSGRCMSILTLRQWPIVSVASLVIDGRTIPASSGPPVSGWYQSGDRTIALYGYTFTRGFGNVVITYTAGFSTVPVRYARACARTVLHWFNELTRIGQASKIVEGENVSFAIALPKDVEDFIRQEADVVPV